MSEELVVIIDTVPDPDIEYDVSSCVAKGGLKVDYETLVADTSGRNAQGDMTIDVINHKYKVGVTFRPLTPAEVYYVMDAIKNYKVKLRFRDPRKNPDNDQEEPVTEIECYTSTPSITWNTLASGIARTNSFTINFIQL